MNFCIMTDKNNQTFQFEIVNVNAHGDITKRIQKQACYQTEDLGNGVSIDMVYIPAGTFIMGSPKRLGGMFMTEKGRSNDEGPQRKLTMKPFYLSKYTITQPQWEAVMGNNPSRFKGKNRPVENISWSDSIDFTRQLSKMTGKIYQLPSEAQWEYAIRAGTKTPFYFGKTITSTLANYDGNYNYASEPTGIYRQETTDVGTFPPNAFGLYDMHGNVWEWLIDVWHDNYKKAPMDGSGWIANGEGQHRLMRGGSWEDCPDECRSAYRYGYATNNKCGRRGVRIMKPYA